MPPQPPSWSTTVALALCSFSGVLGLGLFYIEMVSR